MELYENLNTIIKSKSLTKRKFAEILRNLEPRLKSTGEAPSEKTIYKYLNGNINIPIELIPYIAEALNITEQELFDTSKQTILKLYKYIAKNIDNKQLAYLNQILNTNSTINASQITCNKNNQKQIFHHKKELDKLISLLEFAPSSLIKRIILKLEEIKKISLSDL